MSLVNRASFYLLRAVTFPVTLLSYSQIHALGRALGTLSYFLLPNFRKRALSNLALASSLSLSENEIKRLAIQSFQNLMITCLEYAKLDKESDISRIATCVNPEASQEIMKEGKGVIFFCGHQSNWEILFLEGTTRMPGVAIGRPVKNMMLYNWVLSIRQKFGGKIISPKEAVKEGLRGLKKGCFLGIVGDQGMPDSGFSSPFLGRQAWTSPLPALLAHRTGRPIIVASTKRVGGRYLIHYSDPIWPDQTQPAEQEIPRLMQKSLSLFEESIIENPGEWLWQHNRWKQQTPDRLKRRFRHDSIAVILPEEEESFSAIASELGVLREIYPHEFITLFIPKKFENSPLIENVEKRTYSSKKDLLVRDFRFKMIFNFSSHTGLKAHFCALSAFDVVDLKQLQKAAPHGAPLSQILKTALLRT
ncbi:MAG: hypothetical protein HYX48_05955 [Chlamydiales bacterium]|nr:hypothetical protein [Chlamydiales bacterium]